MKQHSTLIKNGTIVNEGTSFRGSILIEGDKIVQIIMDGETLPSVSNVVDATNKIIIPGVIDDQVHFREPGATHKGNIESESGAAVLGGVTSFMDMPNNSPAATTIEALEAKNRIASESSYANYSFYLGATNDNLAEIAKVNINECCGVKVFMGSSTGNMLVDNKSTLESIFRESKVLVATHCESEPIIKQNLERAINKYGESSIPFSEHPIIRSREACYTSSQEAIELAIKYNTKLHILHVSTKEEIDMIARAKMESKNITAEACVHYMVFDSTMYPLMDSKIKCNPAIKEPADRAAIIEAVANGIIDVVATDHAPHTIEEKSKDYLHAPSGLPLIQHSLQVMLELSDAGHLSIESVVERMCHAPAKLFNIYGRGFIREGYFADIVIIDPNRPDSTSTVHPAYKCGWSPFFNKSFKYSICSTFVNGLQVVRNSKLTGIKSASKLLFNYGPVR